MPPGVILCGGLGTRLRGVLPDRPKCLAPVLNKTYLDYLTDYLYSKGISKFIFATGHGHNQVENWLNSTERSWSAHLSRELSPMGTGGALRLAAEHIDSADFFAFNGDTFLELDCYAMLRLHERAERSVTIATVHVQDTSAYGSLTITDGLVSNFNEKGASGSGHINGGAYLINRDALLATEIRPFSFEQDFLRTPKLNPAAFFTNGLFLDIGTPSTLLQADRIARLISETTTHHPKCE